MSARIEKGVPLPPVVGRGRIPLADRTVMEVGDSYFLAGRDPIKERNTLDMWVTKRQLDWKFAVRSVEGGIRVWRVA